MTNLKFIILVLIVWLFVLALIPTSVSEAETSNSVVINEIYPNPLGSDTLDEFIELTNLSNKEIDLYNWSIEDASSKVYTFLNITILPNEYLVFERSQTKISLNNDGDAVILKDSDGTIIDETEYSENFTEDESFARSEEGIFNKTTDITKGSANLFSEIEELDDDILDDLDLINNPITIAEARGKDTDTIVTIQGTIVAPPELLGKGILYIEDITSGIQIYSSEGFDFDLVQGDVIQVTGILTTFLEEGRIKITDLTDIELLKTGNEINPTIISLNDFDETFEGQLIQTQGSIDNQSGQTFCNKR